MKVTGKNCIRQVRYHVLFIVHNCLVLLIMNIRIGFFIWIFPYSHGFGVLLICRQTKLIWNRPCRGKSGFNKTLTTCVELNLELFVSNNFIGMRLSFSEIYIGNHLRKYEHMCICLSSFVSTFTFLKCNFIANS